MQYDETKELKQAVLDNEQAWGDSLQQNKEFEAAYSHYQKALDGSLGYDASEVKKRIAENHLAWGNSLALAENRLEAMAQYQYAYEQIQNVPAESDQGILLQELTDTFLSFADLYLEKDDPIAALEVLNMGNSITPQPQLEEKKKEVKAKTVFNEMTNVRYNSDGSIRSWDKCTYDANGNVLTDETYEDGRWYLWNEYEYSYHYIKDLSMREDN